MNKLYIITNSHINYRDCGYWAHAYAFINKHSAIDKIINIHKEFCTKDGNPAKILKFPNANYDPSVVQCNDCKFTYLKNINSECNEIDVVKNIDSLM